MTSPQKKILAVLGLLMALVWIRALTPVRSSRSAGRPSKNSVPAAAIPPETAVPPSAEVPEHWGESPFLADRGSREPAAVAGDPSANDAIVLDGILWDLRTPSAIVNNRVVCVGERLGEWEVSEIQKDRVILSNGSERRVLTSSD